MTDEPTYSDRHEQTLILDRIGPSNPDDLHGPWLEASAHAPGKSPNEISFLVPKTDETTVWLSGMPILLETLGGVGWGRQIVGGRRPGEAWAWRKSDKDLAAEQISYEDREAQRKRDQLAENREDWQRREGELPDWLRHRLGTMRAATGETFELEGWGYELAVAELAALYDEHYPEAGESPAVTAYARERGTTGNQHNVAKLLVRVHREAPEQLDNVPAALAPLGATYDRAPIAEPVEDSEAEHADRMVAHEGGDEPDDGSPVVEDPEIEAAFEDVVEAEVVDEPEPEPAEPEAEPIEQEAPSGPSVLEQALNGRQLLRRELVFALSGDEDTVDRVLAVLDGRQIPVVHVVPDQETRVELLNQAHDEVAAQHVVDFVDEHRAGLVAAIAGKWTRDPQNSNEQYAADALDQISEALAEEWGVEPLAPVADDVERQPKALRAAVEEGVRAGFDDLRGSLDTVRTMTEHVVASIEGAEIDDPVDLDEQIAREHAQFLGSAKPDVSRKVRTWALVIAGNVDDVGTRGFRVIAADGTTYESVLGMAAILHDHAHAAAGDFYVPGSDV